MNTISHLINHVVLVLDASTSMHGHKAAVIKVADSEVQHLQQRSKELDQETRLTVYLFGGHGDFECLVYDMDVLRMPSIVSHYQPKWGATAMVDATLQALTELTRTATLYGDHAFLTYVITDGQDNDSKLRGKLPSHLAGLPDNWTVGCFVPDQRAVFDAKGFGFPAGNIAVWDTRSVAGFEEAGRSMRAATESFMVARSSGVRGTRNLFQVAAPTPTDIARNIDLLEALRPGQFRLLEVPFDQPIAGFVEAETRRPYVKGEAYYQLTKSELVQANKEVGVYDKQTHQVYTGPNARKLLGLPDYDLNVSPSRSDRYTIFVQSTSVNRKLIGGTRLLIP